MKKSLSLNARLVFLMIFLGAIPLVILGGIFLYQSQKSMQTSSQNKIFLMRESAKNKIKDFFDKTVEHVLVASKDISVVAGLKEFSSAFELIEQELSKKYPEGSYLKLVEEYYDKIFKDKYQTLNSGDDFLTFNKSARTVSKNGLAAQYAYIMANKNALGEKNKLQSSDLDLSYDKVHQKYHQSFGEYVSSFKYYDFFLVDIKGNVVYSAFKELDFGTNLYDSFTSNTDLAKVFKEALTLDESESYAITDISPYSVSYNLPAAFIARPVVDQGKKIGVLVLQIDLSQITNRTTFNGKWEDAGFGKTGEVYVVAKDLSLRTDLRLFIENKEKFFLTAKNLGMTDDQIEQSKLKGTLAYYGGIKSDLVKRSINSQLELTDSISASGDEKIFQTVSPLGIKGIDWFIVAQIYEKELYADLNTMKFSFYAQLMGFIIAIGFISYFAATRISKTISLLTEKLAGNSVKLLESSKVLSQMSAEISEATTEQASGLQETVSSIDEISAMVAKSADAAEHSQTVSQRSKSEAERGKETIESMIDSMEKINESNNEITEAMEENNKQMHEIVSVINEIGTKTKVINDIVFQTKLLSFNASVEAARAGEHGKGFAVVAEEVGNLAQMSGKAAEEISSMLADSVKKVEQIAQQTAEKVDKLISRGKERINHGAEIARGCGTVLGEILDNAVKVNQMIAEITVASKEQSQGVAEITKAMSQLDQATQLNAASAEKAAVAGGDLSNEAHSMEESVAGLVALVSGRYQKQTSASMENLTKKRKKSSSVFDSHEKREEKRNSFDNNKQEKNIVNLQQARSKSRPSAYEKRENHYTEVHHEHLKSTGTEALSTQASNRSVKKVETAHTAHTVSSITSSGESVPRNDHEGFEEI